MSNYRIEREGAGRGTTVYWRDGEPGAWMRQSESATIFTEVERQRFMGRELRGEPNHKFPVGGFWVIVNEPEHLGDLFVRDSQPARYPYTVIKLRPIVLRISAAITDDDMEGLNAQVDEFEAAVRQFIGKQQVLTGDGWAVDVQTEEE